MSKPILLVHGAWTGSWAWQDIITRLKSRGVRARAVDLPSRGERSSVATDAQAVRDALEALPGPAVLVGHSYAGMVITEAAADNAQVTDLVYVCAALPQAGESLQDLMGRDPTPSKITEGLVTHDDGTAGVDPRAAHDDVFNDATEEQVAPVLEGMGTHVMSTFGEPAAALGWKEHPCTYVVCTRDRILSPELQRSLARNVEHSVELDSAHGPMLTRPEELTDVLRDVAERD